MAITGQVVYDDNPKRFYVLRKTDVSGVSGTGRVADGVEFGDGTVVIRWRTDTASTAIYASMGDLQAIHGHSGATTVRYLD